MYNSCLDSNFVRFLLLRHALRSKVQLLLDYVRLRRYKDSNCTKHIECVKKITKKQ